MDSLDELRLKKKRGVSPKSLLETALENAEDIDDIVISIKFKNKVVTTGYSFENGLPALGMLEISKDDIKDAMRIE